MRKRVAVVAIVVAAMSVLAPPSLAAPPHSLDNATDLNEAIRLEGLMDRHIYNGQVYEVEFKDANRNTVNYLTDFTDSALWTGTYLAAQAFRYQVATKKLARHGMSPADRDFWTSEKAAAMARAVPIAKQYHVLANISGEWKAGDDFNPTFAPPSDPTDPQSTQLSLGRGLLNGEPGLLFRSCIPDNAPAWQQWPYPRRASVFGPFTFEGVTYHCEDATSRDAYAGATFGMITAFDLLGRDAPGVRRQLGTDLLTMADFALKYLWSTPRPHGNFDFNNDLGGPFSPLFLYTPLARMNIVEIARHVATVMHDQTETLKWDAVWAEELTNTVPAIGPSEIQNAYEPDSSYFKFNLEWLTGFDAMRLEPDLHTRQLIGAGMATMEATTGDDLNAHFETLSYALTHNAERLSSAIEHLREWRDWRANYEGLNQSALNSDRCDAPAPDGLTCIARADVTVTFQPLGMPSFFVPDLQTASGYTPKNCHVPNRYQRNNCRSSTPIAIKDRVPTDFLWQRSPFQLDADRSPLHESQGIDYLLPYWMIRYYTEVKAPRREPFPPYIGPSFS